MADAPDLSGFPLRLTRPVYRFHEFQGDSNDCGPTSIAIAINALEGRRELEGRVVAKEMNRRAFEWRPFHDPILPRLPNWATFPWGIVEYLRQRGFRARWRPFGTLKRLDHNLRIDRMTMVVTGEPWRWENGAYRGWSHIKLLFGRLPGRGLIFVDPGCQRSSKRDRLEYHGLFWQDERAFLRQWGNLLRILIEVEKPSSE
ncbi:MAG: hypothetical protein PVJ55_01995 [Anaerolineae bacterium]|jgi:hypothetical protein